MCACACVFVCGRRTGTGTGTRRPALQVHDGDALFLADGEDTFIVRVLVVVVGVRECDAWM